MGKGIDLAAIDAPEHAAVMDDLKDQLLIVFIKRLGGKAKVPVREIDDTGGWVMSLCLDEAMDAFIFETSKKH